MVAQQRMVLVVSGLSQLEVVFTCNDFPCVIGVVVDNILWWLPGMYSNYCFWYRKVPFDSICS